MNKTQKIIDFSNVDSIADGDENFKKELIGIFLEQIPEFVGNLNLFFSGKDYERLAREAHTAKSSVLVFEMLNTGMLLKDIQLWAENKEIDKIGPALKQVMLDLDQANIELQNALKEG